MQSVMRGGGQGRVRVCIDGTAPSGGATVFFKTNRPSVIPTSSSVLIPAGEDCLRFTVSPATVTDDVPVNIIARFAGVRLVRPTTVRNFSTPITPTVTAGPSPSVTSTPVITSTPTATGTVTATSTPTATATFTATATPAPLSFTFAVSGTPVAPGGQVTVVVTRIGGGNLPIVAEFRSSSTGRASVAPTTTTFAASGSNASQTAILSDLVEPGTLDGQVRLRVVVPGFLTPFESGDIFFPGTDPDPTATATATSTPTATATPITPTAAATSTPTATSTP